MRFKRAMAASMAAVMAVSSAVVCQVTASAAALENAPEGTEKVLASIDLANGKYDNSTQTSGPYKTEFTGYWDGGDWVQTPDLGDKDLLTKDNVYVKVVVSNLGDVKHGTDEEPQYSPWSDVLGWGFGNRSWAGVLHWYNNNKQDGVALPENFDVTFVPTEGSTAERAVCYAPISDFSFVSWGNVIAGNFQCANASTMKIESVEIVEFAPSDVAVSSITIDGDAKRTATYGDADVKLTVKANAEATTYDESKVTWASSNKDVATVSTDGKVTFVGAGNVKITATYDNDDAVTASVDFTVSARDVTATITAGDVTGATKEDVADKAKSAVKVVSADLTDKDYTVSVKVDGRKYMATVVLTEEAAKKYELTGTNTASGTIAYKVTGLNLSTNKLAIPVTSTAGVKITATIQPEDLADGEIEWKTADNTVATVEDGLVKPVSGSAGGKTTITATVKGTTYSADCEVSIAEVINPATAIKLDKSELSGTAGDKAELKADVTAKDDTKECTDVVIWESSDEKVATVNAGSVTFVGEGTAEIIVTAGDVSAACKVTVKAKTVAVEKVTLDKTSAELTVGGTAALKATVTPDNATDKTVIWTSSDESVATVKDGTVTAVKAGKAVITAKAGDQIAECTVTVKAKEEKPEEKPDPAPAVNEKEIWSGSTDLGTDWGKSVTVPKADVKIGDTIRIKVSTGSAEYHQVKIMDSSWNVLSSVKSKADAQYGTITVDKDGYVEFVVNAADAKLISEGGLIISGYDLTVSAVSSRAMKEETYAPSTKVHTVVNNGSSQIAVFAISEEDAEKYESYTIIITRGSDGKSVYEIVDGCYKYVSYNNGSENVRVSGNGAYYIMLDITGIEDSFGGITVKIVPTVPKG